MKNLEFKITEENADMVQNVKKALMNWDNDKYPEFKSRLALKATVTIEGDFTGADDNLYREVAETVLFELGNVAARKDFRIAENKIGTSNNTIAAIGLEYSSVEAKQMIKWGAGLNRVGEDIELSAYSHSQLDVLTRFTDNEDGFVNHFNTDRSGHGIGRTRVDGAFSPGNVKITIGSPLVIGVGGGGQRKPNSAEMYAVKLLEDARYGRIKKMIKSLGSGGQWANYVGALMETFGFSTLYNTVLCYVVTGAIADGVFPQVSAGAAGLTDGMVNYAFASKKSNNLLVVNKGKESCKKKLEKELEKNSVPRNFAIQIAKKFTDYAAKHPMSITPL